MIYCVDWISYYLAIINKIEHSHEYLWLSEIKNFKKKYIDIVKKIRPGSLLSGQIESDLNVGERKIIQAKICKVYLLISLKCNFKQ